MANRWAIVGDRRRLVDATHASPLFTVDDYHRMAEAGILGTDDRVELIEGEVVEMSPIGRRHQACLDRMTALFSTRLAGRAIVRIQGPVRLSHVSEPQPDLVLSRPRADSAASVDARPEAVLLLVEVTGASVTYDHEVEAPWFAPAAVAEYWILDLRHDRLLVLGDPDPGAGRYARVDQLARDERIAPLAFPDVEIRVADLLA
ncbi:Uma2 family endonuclease [Thermomicrobium sp. 4228-Ro]|uniref:Uma2 family endonuclease n=1 Tax=Thermomicrobium sp. 4228-Ro TaxID=2993937 RepID=UPI0022498184|nr:Uma2 family endonuclease [Thermomicrobium sp. 4228-Ro]MCX2726878.1 Uma2 family endonuclease [Thermomicrobium sp. 4228-Ro]